MVVYWLVDFLMGPFPTLLLRFLRRRSRDARTIPTIKARPKSETPTPRPALAPSLRPEEHRLPSAQREGVLLAALGELEDAPGRPADVFKEAEGLDELYAELDEVRDGRTVTVDTAAEMEMDAELDEVCDVDVKVEKDLKFSGAGACKVSLLGTAYSRVPRP